jgi:hypothetical protein
MEAKTGTLTCDKPLRNWVEKHSLLSQEEGYAKALDKSTPGSRFLNQVLGSKARDN